MALKTTSDNKNELKRKKKKPQQKALQQKKKKKDNMLRAASGCQLLISTFLIPVEVLTPIIESFEPCLVPGPLSRENEIRALEKKNCVKELKDNASGKEPYIS